MASWITAIAFATVLTVLLLTPAEGHRGMHKVECRGDRMLAFKMLGGRPNVAMLQYKLIDDRCVKVQSDPPSTSDFYISHDCRRCERSSSDKWTCTRMKDEAKDAADKPNCRSVLGPDCKPRLVDKENDGKRCE